VIAYANAMLDDAVPLASGSWSDVIALKIQDGALLISLEGGSEIGLADPAACVGLKGATASPEAILLKRHGLHMEIQIDRNHAIGKSSPAGIKDVLMGS